MEPLQPYPLPPCQAFIDDTRGLLNEFVEALEGRAALLTTGVDHLKTLGLTVACIESSQTGQRVHLSDFYRRQGVPAGGCANDGESCHAKQRHEIRRHPDQPDQLHR